MAETEGNASLKRKINSEGSFEVYGFGYNGFKQLGGHIFEGDQEPPQNSSYCISKSSLLYPLALNVPRVSSIVASWSSTVFVKENGTVQTMGWIPGVKEGGEVENLLPDYFVTDACCSWRRLAFLTSDGECVLWSDYTNGQLHPRKVEASNRKFKAAGCLESSCILLTDDGQPGYVLHEQDQNATKDLNKSASMIFRPMDLMKQMISVACGKEHALLLSSSGEVYSLGNGSRGQLGRGLIVEEQNAAVIPALEGIKIQFIAAGGWHSAAVSECGDLYMWGWNETGQLGLSVNHDDTDDDRQTATSGKVPCQTFPVPMDLPGDLDVMTVSCGSRHTAAIAGDGSVWTWGWGHYGQLGHGDTVSKYTPYQVHFFSSLKHKAKTLCCGDWSTFVITAK
ncbi:RCC1 domain-containing protein 1-like [Porites lutea]|uniref:RCC1 domain-containing protein 1-like n=1 Tax=Porites lutea TaxID=51062 RepID=UPI003CC5FDBF